MVSQEVVHLVRTEEAEVAKLQCSKERPDERPQECASDAQRSRGDGASVVEGGLSKADAACQFNTTPKTVAKWVARFRAEGVDGLRDRSSRPHSSPSQTPPATCAAVETLRRQRHTGKQIAAEVGVSPATVSRILRRLGISRIRDLEPAEPVRRYEREHPGEIIHIDIKKLGRFEQIGHRITGDRPGEQQPRRRLGVRPRLHRRSLARGLLPDPARREGRERRPLPPAAVAYYEGLGVNVTRVMTDNGSCYRAFAFRNACRDLGSNTSAPSPTRPKPTARPSASSRPHSGNGPTLKPIPHQIDAPTSCPSGCTDTTGIGPTAG